MRFPKDNYCSKCPTVYYNLAKQYRANIRIMACKWLKIQIKASKTLSQKT